MRAMIKIIIKTIGIVVDTIADYGGDHFPVYLSPAEQGPHTPGKG